MHTRTHRPVHTCTADTHGLPFLYLHWGEDNSPPCLRCTCRAAIQLHHKDTIRQDVSNEDGILLIWQHLEHPINTSTCCYCSSKRGREGVSEGGREGGRKLRREGEGKARGREGRREGGGVGGIHVVRNDDR